MFNVSPVGFGQIDLYNFFFELIRSNLQIPFSNTPNINNYWVLIQSTLHTVKNILWILLYSFLNQYTYFWQGHVQPKYVCKYIVLIPSFSLLVITECGIIGTCIMHEVITVITMMKNNILTTTCISYLSRNTYHL